MKTKRIVVIKPGKAPEVVTVNADGLKAEQGFCGGYVQEVPVSPKRRYTIWVNEDGLSMGLEYNRRIPYKRGEIAYGAYHEVVGNIVLSQNKDMPDDLIAKILEEWK